MASKRFILALGLMAGVFTMALPGIASAATYAYVNKLGEVSTVTANDWQTAMATALNIHIRSGVMLLDTQAEFEIVGDSIGSL